MLVENNRPGVAARLKIDYHTLRDDQPAPDLRQHLGLRPDRPVVAAGPGFDLIAQAMTGVMSVMGHAGRDAAEVRHPLADLGAGLFAAYGILSAVIRRAASPARASSSTPRCSRRR